jgi:hypothetical protein
VHREASSIQVTFDVKIETFFETKKTDTKSEPLHKSTPPTKSEMIERNKMIFPSKLKALQRCTGKKTGIEMINDIKIIFYENVIYVHRNGFLYAINKNGNLSCESLDRPFIQPPLGPAPTPLEEEIRLETLEEHIFNCVYGAISYLLSEKKCSE